MKVLIWHDDNGLWVYDATDESAAYFKMFKDMDDGQHWTAMGLDEPIVETVPPTRDSEEVRYRRLYQRAKGGDIAAARRLCEIASSAGWEYQYSDIYDVR